MYIEKFVNLQSLELVTNNACCPFGSCRSLYLAWNKVMSCASKFRFWAYTVSDSENIELLDRRYEDVDLTETEINKRCEIDIMIEPAI